MTVFIKHAENGRVDFVHYIPAELPQDVLNTGVIVEGAPTEPQPEFGKRAVLYYKDGTLAYVQEDRPLTDEERLSLLVDASRTANQRYEAINLAAANLEDLKAARIEALKEDCTNAIYAGFTSKSLNKEFGFNANDQANFAQQYLIVVSGDNAGKAISWKSKQGIVTMSEAEFRGLIQETAGHKMSQQAKYWKLEAAVLAAKTIADVDSVRW